MWTRIESLGSPRLTAAEPIRRAPHVLWVVGLTALALVLRVAFALIFQPTSLTSNDALFYHAVAAQIADGHGFSLYGEPTAHWPPVGPYLFGAAYRVAGPDPLAAVLVNAVLGAATVALLYVTALKALGPVAARFAAGVLAVMPGQILFADTLLAETAYTFILVGFLALVAWLPERRWWVPVALGAVAGIAALTRGEGLVLPVIALAAWWPELPWRALLGRMAALVVAMAVVVVPWTVRNAAEAGSFVGVATNSSTTLWSGHNPKADGGATYAPPSLLAPATKKTGIEFEVAEGRLLRREALEYMRSHPLRELTLIPRKLVSLNEGDSKALDVWIHEGEGAAYRVADVNRFLERGGTAREFGRVPSRAPAVIGRTPARVVGVLADVAYYALLAATLVSVVLFWRRLWGNRVMRGALAMVGAAMFLYGFVYYGNFRYRVPLEPLMLLLAAPLAVWLPGLRASRRAHRRAGRSTKVSDSQPSSTETGSANTA